MRNRAPDAGRSLSRSAESVPPELLGPEYACRPFLSSRLAGSDPYGVRRLHAERLCWFLCGRIGVSGPPTERQAFYGELRKESSTPSLRVAPLLFEK